MPSQEDYYRVHGKYYSIDELAQWIHQWVSGKPAFIGDASGFEAISEYQITIRLNLESGWASAALIKDDNDKAKLDSQLWEVVIGTMRSLAATYGDGSAPAYPKQDDLFSNAVFGSAESPGSPWDNADITGDDKKRIEKQLEGLGIQVLINNEANINRALRRWHQPGQLSDQEMQALIQFFNIRGTPLYNLAVTFFPNLNAMMDAYAEWSKAMGETHPGGRAAGLVDAELAIANDPGMLFDQYMNAFTAEGKRKFEWAGRSLSTNKIIGEWAKKNFPTESISPDATIPVLPWEVRIGATKLIVPPINIQVSQVFQAGSLTGGAIRQQQSPKFNSGHSETVLNMTLYFPNHESIWGFFGQEKTIDFREVDPKEVDFYLSSLAGLITQFKYAPILPIRSEYINRTYGITAVCLKGMSISTVEDYPFCLAVNLQMMKFNHKVFLPMLEDFNSAVHWGRYRLYMGMAAAATNRKMHKLFPETTTSNFLKDPSEFARKVVNSVKNQADLKKTYVGVLDKQKDLGYNWKNGKYIEFYYPAETPARTFAPDTTSWRQPYENQNFAVESSAWQSMLDFLGFGGFEAVSNPEMLYENMEDWDDNYSQAIPSGITTKDLVWDYLINTRNINEAERATKEELDDYLEARAEQMRKKAEKEGKEYTAEQQEADEAEVRLWWMRFIYSHHRTSPLFQKYMAEREYANAQYRIQEWAVPMVEMEFDPKKMIVSGISVSLSNNFAKHQLQMQEDPTYQHIGGGDAQIDIALTVFGEDELIKLRRVFKHVSGLARLEAAHGVLGFLGIKNPVSILAGIKYVLPLAFEVDTIPGYPHVYNVRISMTDFDPEQQKREELSSSQQKELVAHFGKRNPFLRLKQLWGSFNAYPDFPLAIYDDNGDLIGHLDPDFYFRAYQTVDDDLVNWNLEQRLTAVTTNASGENSSIETYFTEDEAQFAMEDGEISEADWAAQYIADNRVSRRNDPTIEGTSYTQKLMGGSLPKIDWVVGVHGENQDQIGALIQQGSTLTPAKALEDGTIVPQTNSFALVEDTPAGTLTVPAIQSDTAKFAPFAAYGNPLVQTNGVVDSNNPDASAQKSLGVGDPAAQFESIMLDHQYRELSGRMIRAYPTYMLWLIDEGGKFAGVKLFDNFYGLQSVIDFSVHSSEDSLEDTLVLRVSNLYNKLSTNYKLYLGQHDGTTALEDFVDQQFIEAENLVYGAVNTTDTRYVRTLSGIRLKPGVRVHLRVGYGSNPNSLQTVFNGTITNVQYGDIVEVTAQSDAVELSPYVNTSNEDAHSGKIDGGFNTGLWLSEPRDLMVRLLSMGSSTFREGFAHALQGKIFSENRFGIRHFGQILYEPLSSEEANAQNERYRVVSEQVQKLTSNISNATEGGFGSDQVKTAGFDALLGNVNVRSGSVELLKSMWVNSFRYRDYELFKRNIYPGNGTGIAQYLGGDFPDAGLVIAEAAGADGGITRSYRFPLVEEFRDAQGVEKAQTDQSRLELEAAGRSGISPGQTVTAEDLENQTSTIGQPDSAQPGLTDVAGSVFDAFTGILDKNSQNPILASLGINSSMEDDDISGFDEVSFRAQTYMKSVWDLFQLCAALLPNYVVAVRPFEDRSTVFYGKPHWLYTSGVVPVSTGVKPEDDSPQIAPDEKINQLLADAANQATGEADLEAQIQLINSTMSVGPAIALDTLQYRGPLGAVHELPLEKTTKSGHNIRIPKRSGKVVFGMHLATSNSVVDEIRTHRVVDGLDMDPKYQFPENMFFVGGPQPKTMQELSDNSAKLTPRKGFFGTFDKVGFGPEEEVYYIGMRWPFMMWGDESNANTMGRRSASYQRSGNEVSATTAVDGYSGAKVAVYCLDTGKTVVCAIGDTWPLERDAAVDEVAVLSPEAMAAIGAKDGSRCFFGFVNDDVPIGPAETGSPVDRTQLETLYNTQARQTLRADTPYEGGSYSDSLIDAGIKYQDSVSQDPLWEYGHRQVGAFVRWGGEEEPWVHDPVGHFARRMYDRAYDKKWAEHDPPNPDYASIGLSEAAVFSSAFPDLGQLEDFAKDTVGGDDVSIAVTAMAQQCWDEFRNEFHLSPEGGDDWVLSIYLESQWHTRSIDPSASWQDSYRWDKMTDDQKKDIFNTSFMPHRLVDAFKKYLWSTAYRRAWLYIVADVDLKWFAFDVGVWGWQKQTREFQDYLDQVSDEGNLEKYARATTWFLPGVDGAWDFVFGDPANEFEKLTTTPSGGSSAIVDLNQVEDKFIDFWVPGRLLSENDVFAFNETGAIKDAWREFLRITEQMGEPGWTSILDVPGVAGVSEAEFSQNEYITMMDNWLKEHQQPGRKSDTVLDRLGEELLDTTIGRLLQAAGDALQGLLAVFRQEMQLMGMGLDMVGTMQKQSHILNKIFNDSIYYAASSNPNSILRLADNPFTREYGEPVIEVREPFQRMHYISSFQHILSNTMQENNGVATVVTASSDGKYPVTVYFDRGLPSERQVEKAVETGLFWDNYRGSGFFSFLHPLLHPIETMRGLTKTATGSSDELLSKRVGLYHLKESLKDIYGGEIIILGNADIRPHDLVYIADIYERVYGVFEVEAVNHHFTPEDGFITGIVPNAVVIINDPARWSYISWMQALMATRNVREDVRHLFHVYADNTSEIKGEGTSVAHLAESIEVPLQGHLMYVHGNSAIVKDVTASYATGLTAQVQGIYDIEKRHREGDVQASDVAFAGADFAAGMIPGVNIMTDFVWDAWDWVRENLIDQHGCYIQYLTKDGQAMDAGLSYAQGVAVGQHHSVTLLPSILGIDVKGKDQGNIRITQNDMLAALGWHEVDIAKEYRHASWWVSKTNSEILALGGRGVDRVSSGQPPPARLVRVVASGTNEGDGVIDADTFEVEDIEGNGGRFRVRLTGVNSPEVHYKMDSQQGYNLDYDPGYRALLYTRKRMLEDLPAQWGDSIVAFRQDNLRQEDDYGRQLGVIFHNVPQGTPADKRNEVLREQANRWPSLIEWTSFMEDGRPYTFNWELVMAGHADVMAYDLTQWSDRGVEGTGY